MLAFVQAGSGPPFYTPSQIPLLPVYSYLDSKDSQSKTPRPWVSSYMKALVECVLPSTNRAAREYGSVGLYVSGLEGNPTPVAVGSWSCLDWQSDSG
jgi:hypothetical protein